MSNRVMILQNTTGDFPAGSNKALPDFDTVLRDDKGWFQEGSYTAPNWEGPTPFTQWLELTKGDYWWELQVTFSEEPAFTWMASQLVGIDDRLNDLSLEWNSNFPSQEHQTVDSMVIGSGWAYAKKGLAHVPSSLSPLKFAVIGSSDLVSPETISSLRLGVKQL